MTLVFRKMVEEEMVKTAPIFIPYTVIRPMAASRPRFQVLRLAEASAALLKLLSMPMAMAPEAKSMAT